MTTYDLSPMKSHPGFRNHRILRWVFSVVVVLVLVYSAYVMAVVASRGQLTVTNVAFVALALFVDGMFVVILFGLAADPVSVDVDSEGVRIRFPGNRVRSLTWGNPKFRLVLSRTDGGMDLLSRGKPLCIVRGNRPFQGLLTFEAFDGIVQEARLRGLQVQVQPPRRFWTDVRIVPTPRF